MRHSPSRLGRSKADVHEAHACDSPNALPTASQAGGRIANWTEVARQRVPPTEMREVTDSSVRALRAARSRPLTVVAWYQAFSRSTLSAPSSALLLCPSGDSRTRNESRSG